MVPSKGKVVIIDDNASLTESLQFLIVSFGYETAAFVYPEDVQETLKQERPDLIITDINMPVMNGITLVETLRADGWNTPVIFITAYNDDELALASRELKDTVLLNKPFQPEQLLELIDQVLKKKSRR
jgi:two-component system chemotaxis response regulator CheY